MEKRIIYTRPDGGVSVIIPAPGQHQLVRREDAVVRYRPTETEGTYCAIVLAPEAVTSEVVTPPEGSAILADQSGTPIVALHASAFRQETDDEVLERLKVKDVPSDASDVMVCDASDLPAQREFRGAWAIGGQGVDVDMDDARAIHMQRVRANRNRRLAALDGKELAALGTGDEVALATVRAEKQELRDAPQSIAADVAAAGTPEELLQVVPECLA